MKADPSLAFARCVVLAGSSTKEYKLKQIDPAGHEHEEFTAPIHRVWNSNDETVDPMSLNDIGLLNHQNTAAVLAFLRDRFMKNQIYVILCTVAYIHIQNTYVNVHIHYSFLSEV